MAFDGLVCRLVCEELQQVLSGGRLERIHQPNEHEVLLVIFRYGERHRLLISTHPQRARLHLTNAERENPARPLRFCQVMRKHLSGARIQGFSQRALDRIVEIELVAWNRFGEQCQPRLIAELTGRFANLVLVDEAGIILDGIKQLGGPTTDSERDVFPGAPYRYPPSQAKLSLDKCSESALAQVLRHSSGPVWRSLLQTVDGIGPLVARELIRRAGFPPDTDGPLTDISPLCNVITALHQQIAQGDLKPVLLRDRYGLPREVVAIAITAWEGTIEEKESISAVLDQVYSQLEKTEAFRSQAGNLQTIIKKHLQRAARKLSARQSQLLQAEDADRHRRAGELLTAHLHMVRRGMTEVTVPDFYDPQGRRAQIALDPQLDPAANAQSYFHLYRKAQRTIAQISERIDETKQEISYLEGIATALAQAETLADIEAIADELTAQGYLKKGRSRPRAQGQSQPRRFCSSQGYLIMVGRNNRHNDYLTLRWAQPDDVWLHTKDLPGSHVIIRRDNPAAEVPAQTLGEAARLAAYFSKGRWSSNVPVDYTYCRYVRKPAGAKPGYVIYDHHRTIFVTPEQTEVMALQD